MSCGDSKFALQSLLGDCGTLDIGCLPKTTGEPEEAPDSDSLPFAYDDATKSLWFYLCDDEIWVSFRHETICELPSINQAAVDAASKSEIAACIDGVDNLIPRNRFSLCELDNNGIPIAPHIINLCDQVEIPIRYISNDDGLCYEEVITFGEFSIMVTECLAIPPAYALCDQLVRSQANVDAATSVLIAACVDGVDSLIPRDRFSLCELQNNGIPAVPHVLDFCTQVEIPIRYISSDDGLCYEQVIRVNQLASEIVNCLIIPDEYFICNQTIVNQTTVDGAASILVGACLDGADVQIPYIPAFTVCNLPTDTQPNLDAATLIEVGACVDGVDTKISIAQLKLLLA